MATESAGAGGLARGSVLIEARGLIRTYGTGESAQRALDGLSLEIRQGELLAILGSSGSGKTTLLNMLGGLDRPDQGDVLFRGNSILRGGDREMTRYRKEHVGFIFQHFNLIPELTVYENVDLTADRARDPKIVERVLDRLGLSGRGDAYPSQLSGGQQQRVSIARALAKRSAVLLCDEPTGALDYETGKEVLTVLEQLVREDGETVAIVTHTREVGRMADRSIRLRSGRIQDETVNERAVSAREIEW